MTRARGATLGVALAVLCFAALTAVRAAYVLAYALLLLLALSWAWSRGVSGHLRLSRRRVELVPQVGGKFEETVTLERSGRWPVPLVEVQDLSEPALPGGNRLVALVGRRRSSWKVRGTFGRRGWYSFGPARARFADPFGLFPRQVDLPAVERVLVLPRTVPLSDLMAGGQLHHDGFSSRSSLREAPPDTAGVREYSPSERLGRIHWPTTLRSGTLMVRQFEQPTGTDLWVVLDLERSIQRGQGEESTLEYAVTLAASLVTEQARRGRRVGLAAGGSHPVVMSPTTSRRSLADMMERLAVVEADGSSTLADLLLAIPGRRADTALAVVTCSTAPGWGEPLAARRPGAPRPVVFFVDAASFEGPDGPVPRHLAAGSELWVVRSGGRLRRWGSPQELSLAG
ncbi:MAG: DUF58 domain-containing protein [Candidatus Dormibacteria bacterium]